MKQHIESLLQQALATLQEDGVLPSIPTFIQVDMTKDKQHGDYATNIAMVLAKAAGQKPRAIAEKIISHLPTSNIVEKVEIAGPGFINFFMTPAAFTNIIRTILTEKERFGRSQMGRKKRVIVEFLSSNPTGPLHVGHGRHAAFGAVVANLLDAVGFNVYREYYVNDAGRQMDILTVSIWLRYLSLCGEEVSFPENAYQGQYIIDIARMLHNQFGSDLHFPADEILKNLPDAVGENAEKEQYMDALIERARLLLGAQFDVIFKQGLETIVSDIREDLAEFGVQYDNWFSERQFVASGVVDELLKKLNKSGDTYEQDGALWFRSTKYGDEKDRVLVRSNGTRTYFANDVAYHLSKFERGFDIAIDIFGADHHGYVPRMKAAMQASGINPERLLQLLVQFVSLYRGDVQVPMSTRGGNFVTLRELRQEVGNDAARFFYVMRKAEQHMDFDLELAKSQSNENPVYYIQYAYARIASVLKQMQERQMTFDEANAMAHLELLTAPQEIQLQSRLTSYSEMIVNAALQYEPHILTHYLRDLAGDFHTYYNSHQFLIDDVNLRNARLALVLAIRQILLNGFSLLGISAPESM